MSYLYLYYLATALSLLFLPFIVMGDGTVRSNASSVLMFVVGVIYLLGMTRSQGVDIEIYRLSYYYNSDIVPDPGYSFLSETFSAAGIPFGVFMFVLGAVNLLAIIRLSKFYSLNSSLLIVIWFLHLVVVRDFAQFRVGVAVSIVILGITTKSNAKKLILYGVATSLHLTSIFLLAGYELCKRISRIRTARKRNFTLVFVLAITCVFGLVLLPVLEFIDPRIGLYLSWSREGYGLPVNSYGTLFLHFFLVFLVVLVRRSERETVQFKTLLYLEFLSIALFLSMSEYAVFAFRLSNVTSSLYPVLLLMIAGNLRLSLNGMGLRRVSEMSLIVLMSAILIIRPGTYNIIHSILL